MNNPKTLMYVGLLVAIIGIIIMLYAVFDGEKTSTTIRNVAFSFVIVGSALTMYGKKLSGKNTKSNK
jgi:EamA domain-containing membrane protein RarD